MNVLGFIFVWGTMIFSSVWVGSEFGEIAGWVFFFCGAGLVPYLIMAPLVSLFGSKP